MSFGGGFGSNTGGGFGGFGSNNNNTNTTSGSSLFGGNTATAGGFGGFGSNNNTNNSPFGAAKTGGFGSPATSTGGSLFGGGTSTTGGFGGTGFGANNNTGGATLSSGFGSNNNAGTSLFGAKANTGGFGSTGNTGTSLFGGSTGGFGQTNNATSNPFGGGAASTTTFGASNNTTGGFGASNTTNNTFGGFGNNATNNTTTGTPSTPFQPFTEKDGTTANATAAYQSITMQSQFQGKSFDELRLEDYTQNKRYPQSGSFGANNTFGGFGSNTTNNTTNTQARPSLFGATGNTGFGATNNTSTGFGASNNTGFGATNNNTTGGGLFGAKPATPSLFGGNTASTTTGNAFGGTSNTGGGLFGSTNNATSGGFGSSFGNNNASNTGGGLFGNNANNQQKPAGFGGFGSTNNATTTGGFGGGFGNATNNNTTTQSGGLFGSSTTNNSFGGGTTGGGLFGNANNAAKPASGGLFGSTPAANTGGGLFGSAQPTNNNAFGNTGGSSLFGSNTQSNNNTGGGLFGGANNAAKPATGLFGSAPAAGGSLFGGGQAANTQGNSLFGGANNNAGSSLFNQQKPATGGLFGGSTTGGNSLFGGGNTNTNNNSMFGGNQQGAGNSLFGNSQGNAGGSLFGGSQGPQQNQLTSSITGDPYGNGQLFASLAAPNPPVGPLATPLQGAKPAPKARASLLASVRGGSPMLGASTSLTPRGRPGYGFSYSTLNTPTGTPVLTPGASSLLRPAGSIGTGMSSRLSKSFSTSNLRGDSDGTSLLRTPAPGQSSLLLGSGSLGSGSVRRLKIDRTLRTDLFGDTPKKNETAKESEKEPELRKRVSFDKSVEKDAATPIAKPSAANALVLHEEDAATPKAPEMSQVGNSSLTTVHEEAASDKAQSPRRHVEAGEYYTEPSLKQIKSMSRGQLSSLKSFTVGRQGVGKIQFGRNGTVDLSTVSLDDICGKIVQLKPRSATVYEDDSDKPPVGRGLNLPSTIWLEQSWPRASRASSATPQKSSQKDIDRHKARLKRVNGTKFLDYDDNTGIWTFTVEHFTTYELDDEDETTVNEGTIQEAGPAQSSAELPRQPASDVSSPIDIPDLGDQDDTFQFKLDQRSHQNGLTLPGGFDESMAHPFDLDEASADEMQEDNNAQANGFEDSAMIDPFLEDAGAAQPGDVEHFEDDDMEEDGKELPGSFHAEPDALKSILKPSAYDESLFNDIDNFADLSWEDQLQRTLSPKKRDRQALRDLQSQYADKGPAESDSLLKKSLLSRSQLGVSHLGVKSAAKKTAGAAQPSEAFTTSMDIMRSLWADAKQPSISAEATKASKKSDTQFHNAFKPSFTNNETVVFAGPGGATKQSSDMTVPLKPAAGDQRDVKYLHASTERDENTVALLKLQQGKDNTYVEIDDMDEDDEDEEGPVMPTATTSNRIPFKTLADAVSASISNEKNIWQLCSVLFDPLEICAASMIEGMDDGTVDELQTQIRKDLFLDYWTSRIVKDTEKQLRSAKIGEEKAILQLCLGDALSAAETLMTSGNPRLAIQIAQLPASEMSREIGKKQIEDWQKRKDWSEFSTGQRALYSIIAGNTARVAGMTKAAPEDRVADFDIGTAFGLSWQQSLALRVGYSGEESFPHAIDAYVNDLKDGVEVVRPVPSHGQAQDSEDVLLSLLKLITEQETSPGLLDPSTVNGNAFHHRLTWQLATLLAARGVLQPSDDQMDALTVDLSAELEASGDYLDALWVLLHLNDNDSRYAAVKAVLERNSDKIPDPVVEGKTGDFEFITVDLLVPASLVWHAKALYAKGSLQDPVLQCQYLLRSGTAESFQEAHDVLCQKVGPLAVIEQYYEDLERLIQHFHDIGSAHFDGWATGGLVYLYFCQLLSTPAAKARGRDYEALLKKLDKSLRAQQEAGDQGVTLEMRVARIEMRKAVTEKAKQIDDWEKWYKSSVDAAKYNKGITMLEQYMQALGQVH